MLRYSISFLLILIIAGILAFGNATIGIAHTAKIVFFMLLPFFVISSLLGAFILKKDSMARK